jgi:hypothetical protein
VPTISDVPALLSAEFYKRIEQRSIQIALIDTDGSTSIEAPNFLVSSHSRLDKRNNGKIEPLILCRVRPKPHDVAKVLC